MTIEILILALVGLLVAPIVIRLVGGAGSGTTAPTSPRPARPEGQIVKLEPRKRPSMFATIGELSGRAYVIDGDTIVIKGTKIRLAGIDAPELDQPFGQKSKWAMVELCKGHVVTAKLNGETSHDRLVGTCYLPDGRDIGAELIKRGLALDWTFHSGGKYRQLEPRGIRGKLHNTTAWR